MEIQTTFCHNQDESARDLSPPPSCQNPLDWLSGQLDDLKTQAGFDDADWGLIEKYLLMPLFDIHSIRELAISAKERNRLYWLMSQKYRPLEKVLTQVGYELFFAEVEAFESASACDRSRYRPHLIGDDTKVAKTHACCMEYLTELFCPAEGLKLPAYNLVVLCATFGDTDWEIPVAIKLWVPKAHPDYQSKPKLLKAIVD